MNEQFERDRCMLSKNCEQGN